MPLSSDILAMEVNVSSKSTLYYWERYNMEELKHMHGIITKFHLKFFSISLLYVHALDNSVPCSCIHSNNSIPKFWYWNINILGMYEPYACRLYNALTLLLLLFQLRSLDMIMPIH